MAYANLKSNPLPFLSSSSTSPICAFLGSAAVPVLLVLLFSLWHIIASSGRMGMVATEAQFHVLAVDDSLIDRKLIEKLLKTSSYQVTAVDSGSKALEFLGLGESDQRDSNESDPVSPDHHQDVEVNLIITDYCMPGMTGFDLLRKIKESKSLKNIPVVIMSSENVPSRINRCLEEGAEEFFLKPVRLSDVNKLRPHLMKGRSKEDQPNNKRKGSVEETNSPDRTKTRYNIDQDIV